MFTASNAAISCARELRVVVMISMRPPAAISRIFLVLRLRVLLIVGQDDVKLAFNFLL
jgi:hypothetical protein